MRTKSQTAPVWDFLETDSTADEAIELSEYVSCFVEMLSDDIGILVAYDDVTENIEFVRKEGGKYVVSFGFLGLEYEATDFVNLVDILDRAIDAAISDPAFQSLIDTSVDAWDEKRMWVDAGYKRGDGIEFLDSLEAHRLHRTHNVREFARAIAVDIDEIETNSSDRLDLQFVRQRGSKFLLRLVPLPLEKLCGSLEEAHSTLIDTADLLRCDPKFQKLTHDMFDAMFFEMAANNATAPSSEVGH